MATLRVEYGIVCRYDNEREESSRWFAYSRYGKSEGNNYCHEGDDVRQYHSLEPTVCATLNNDFLPLGICRCRIDIDINELLLALAAVTQSRSMASRTGARLQDTHYDFMLRYAVDDSYVGDFVVHYERE